MKKYSILYSIQRNDFCFPTPPPSFITGLWEVYFGRGVVAKSWVSVYVSNMLKTFNYFKPEAKIEIILEDVPEGDDIQLSGTGGIWEEPLFCNDGNGSLKR